MTTLSEAEMRALIGRRRQEAVAASARPNVARLSNKMKAAWEAEKDHARWVLAWCDTADQALAAGPYDDAVEAQLKALYLEVNLGAPSVRYARGR